MEEFISQVQGADPGRRTYKLLHFFVLHLYFGVMGSTPKFRLRLFGQIPFRQKKLADFFLFLQRFSSSPRRREAADNGVGALQKTLFYVLKVLLYSRSRQKQGTQVPPLGRLCTDLISFPFHRSFPVPLRVVRFGVVLANRKIFFS